MTSFYDEYMRFIQEDKSIKELVEQDYVKYVDEYEKRIMFTLKGSKYITTKFEVIFNTEFYELEKNAIEIASFLSLSQSLGGLNFIRYFREKISSKRSLKFINILINYIPQLQEKNNSSFERPYEEKMRFYRYNECKDIVSGYETYMTYQRSTLCFETERLLPDELVFALDAILLCNQEEFVTINKKNTCILWPLRSIDRFRHEDLKDLDIIEDAVKITAGLALEKQGVLLAHLWESVYQMLKDINEMIRFINKFTSLVFDNLSIETSLNIISCISSDLVNDNFRIKRHFGIGDEEEKKALCELLSNTASYIKLKKISFEKITTYFLYNLKGKVNKEERYVGLVLANIIDEVDEEKAKGIRRFIIDEYPSFWENERKEHSKLYFSGSLTLNLIDELANAIISCLEGEELKKYLSEIKEISSTFRLKKLKEKHDYQRYLDEVNKAIVHGILTEKVNLIQIEKGNEIDGEFLCGVFNFAIGIIIEISDNYIEDSQKLLVQRLAQYLGQLADKNINIFSRSYGKLINWVYDSNILAKIIAEIHVEDIKEILLNHLRDVIKIERYSLRTSKLIERAWDLYEAEAYKEAKELISEISKDKLNCEEFRRLKLILIYSNLQIAFRMKDIEEQVTYLLEAESKSYMQNKTNNFYTNNVGDELLKIQISGWLYDRARYDVNDLINNFHALNISSIDLKENESQQMVLALALVRILSSKSSGTESYLSNMHSICKCFKNDSKMYREIVLIKAWYHNFINDIELEINDLDNLRNYSEIEDKEIEWLPNALKEYYYEHIGKLNE